MSRHHKKPVELVAFIDYTSLISRSARGILTNAVEAHKDHIEFSYKFFPSPTRHPESEIAAKAAIAADLQGKFEAMHERLLIHEKDFCNEDVTSIASQLGLDVQKFTEDINSDRVQERLNQDLETAAAANLTVTPGMTIDGRAYTGAWDEDALSEAIKHRRSGRVETAMESFFSWGASAAFTLLIATTLALLVVNLGFQEQYEWLRDTNLGFVFGSFDFLLHMEVWINDAFMGIFFLLIGLEIKREILSGELSDIKRAAMPVIGAIGGMFVPALLYALVNVGGEGAHGWGIPMATDIAFTLGLMALLGNKVPVSLKIFISALAVSDDLGAIVVIAIFYGHGFHLDAFLFALLIIAIMAVLNYSKVYSKGPYILLGMILWYFTYESGLHATLAGVLTAALIPSRRSGNLIGVATQAATIFEQEIAYAQSHPEESIEGIRHSSLRMIQNAIERLKEPGYYLEHELERFVNYIILPLFAFFNTGILIAGTDINLFSPVNLGVIVGLCLGKPLGIVGACWIATKLKIASISEGLTWTHMIGAGSLAGVGFTMSIVVASSAFTGAALDSIKLSILIASALSGIVGLLLLRRAVQ